MERLIGICALAFVLGAAAPVLADTVNWDDGDPDEFNWSSPDNWDTDTEPTSSDVVYLDGGGLGITDVYSSTATCYELIVSTSAEHVLTIYDGGVLDVVFEMIVSDDFDAAAPRVEVGSGGTLLVGDDLAVCYPMHSSARGELVNWGGVIDIGGTLRVTYDFGGSSGSGELYLFGGGLYCAELWAFSDDYINLTEGALYIKGDVTAQIAALVSGGQLEAYNGTGWVETALVTLSSPKAGAGEYTKVTAHIPEPGVFLLVGLGAAALFSFKRKR